MRDLLSDELVCVLVCVLVGGAAVRLVLVGPQPVLPLVQTALLRTQGRLLLGQLLQRDKCHLSQIRFVDQDKSDLFTCRSAAS